MSRFLKFAVVAVMSALLALPAFADLQVLVPGGPNLWWIANSQNTIIWTCNDSPYQNFTVYIANSNPTTLTAPLAIIAIQQNTDCSKLISATQSSLPVGTGYTIQLVDPINPRTIYASSQPFEIKPLGSSYPASSATPTGFTTSTSTAAGASPTATDKKNAAGRVGASVALGLGLALVGVLAA